MTSAINPTSEVVTLPYLTVAEYKNAPTAISTSNLINKGTQEQQDAELTNVIFRASAWIDSECHQSLVAQTRTEQKTVLSMRGNEFSFSPDRFPIVSLNSLSYGNYPSSLVALSDVSNAWINGRLITLPTNNFPTLSNNFSFGSLIRYTYVHGFVNTVLPAVTATDTSFTLTNPDGITASQILHIADGAKSESVQVAANYVYGSSLITLVAPLVNAHDAGTAIHSMPSSLKQAAILLTSAFIKVRGTQAAVLSTTATPNGAISGSRGINTDTDIARDLLVDFVRKF